MLKEHDLGRYTMPPYTAWQETRDLKQYYLNGFPSLAAFIASDKDKTTFIFKKFDGLAARSLIHLQSKLADLQKLQDEYDAEEAKQDLHRKQLSHNWSDFCQAAVSDPKQKARLELAEQIQATLKDYRMSQSNRYLPVLTFRTGEALLF